MSLLLTVLIIGIITSIIGLVYYRYFAPDGSSGSLVSDNLSGARNDSKNRQKFNSPIIDAFLESVPKEGPKYEVVSIGDSNHKHNFVEADWDRERFGSSITDMDKDYGRKIEFPCGTFKDLSRCVCGTEVIRNERALI